MAVSADRVDRVRVCSAGFFDTSSASAAGSLAPLYYNCTRLYRSKHILTQSNTGKAGPQPSLPGPI